MIEGEQAKAGRLAELGAEEAKIRLSLDELLGDDGYLIELDGSIRRTSADFGDWELVNLPRREQETVQGLEQRLKKIYGEMASLRK